MAKYIYSIPTYRMLGVIADDMKKIPEQDREYLPETLRSSVKDMLSFLKNDAPVCIDPSNGYVTIDQIRMYAYKDTYSSKDKEIRQDIVEKFAENLPEIIKDYAQGKISSLDWEDDETFRQAMEDITVEYDAYAALDPETYAPYGILYRHNSTMSITKCGLRHSSDLDEDKSLTSYFDDKDYQKTHMEKVKERYDGLKAENTPTKTTERYIETYSGSYNPWFFNAFSSAGEAVR